MASRAHRRGVSGGGPGNRGPFRLSGRRRRGPGDRDRGGGGGRTARPARSGPPLLGVGGGERRGNGRADPRRADALRGAPSASCGPKPADARLGATGRARSEPGRRSRCRRRARGRPGACRRADHGGVPDRVAWVARRQRGGDALRPDRDSLARRDGGAGAQRHSQRGPHSLGLPLRLVVRVAEPRGRGGPARGGDLGGRAAGGGSGRRIDRTVRVASLRLRSPRAGIGARGGSAGVGNGHRRSVP